jgi:hypothetical protein
MMKEMNRERGGGCHFFAMAMTMAMMKTDCNGNNDNND